METTKINDIKLKITQAKFISANALLCFDKNNFTISRYVEEYELVLFKKTGGYFCVDGKKYKIYANSVRLYKPGEFVYSYRFGDVYTIHFTVGDGVCSSPVLDSLPTQYVCEDEDKITEHFKNITQDFLNGNVIGSNFNLWAVFNMLLISQKSVKKSDSVSEKVKKYIRENYKENVSLSDMGKAVFLHPNYLHKVFCDETGVSPAKFLLETRLSVARKLLLCTDMTAENIAVECGFCNSSYFIRKFKEKYNLSPAIYRKELSKATYGQL